MNIDFFSFDGIHPLGGSATHPIEPLAKRLGSLRLPRPPGRHAASGSVLRRRPCGAQPCLKADLLQAVQTCAGTFGTKAFALPRRVAAAHSGASNRGIQYLTSQVFAYHAKHSNIPSHSSRGRDSYKFKLAPTVCVGVAPSRRRPSNSGSSGLGSNKFAGAACLTRKMALRLWLMCRADNRCCGIARPHVIGVVPTLHWSVCRVLANPAILAWHRAKWATGCLTVGQRANGTLTLMPSCPAVDLVAVAPIKCHWLGKTAARRASADVPGPLLCAWSAVSHWPAGADTSPIQDSSRV